MRMIRALPFRWPSPPNPTTCCDARSGALGADDEDTAKITEASSNVASGMDRTLDTTGDKPYRFDVVCDTDGVSTVTLTVTRGEAKRPFGVRCGDRQALCVNVPAGPAFAVTMPPIDKEPLASGVTFWNLISLEPHRVHGCCLDDSQGCKQ
ncbi:hypothetical protein [Streptomyces lavendulae]|uniref:hypothetical protein n=1 Tax=Streptomyces lavendulae TaxID=1914 RepID=UPI0024A2943E|nr:hypothetical protein [Streptomyces lavendulae]GLW04633.1 hypothetical protein Slala05_82630 [Streptomyces lavendulae subsp. lavendulae]